MTRAARVIEGYLARHAEKEATLVGDLSSQHGYALTVPVYDEGDSFFRLLSSLGSEPSCGPLGSTLVIAVVNARDDSGEAVLERNQLTQSRLRDTFPETKPLGDGALLHTTAFGQLLCIDRSSRARLPRKRGVGLARKVACDLALALRAKGKIASRWIHLTDADAVLPADYFARTHPFEGSAQSGEFEASDPLALGVDGDNCGRTRVANHFQLTALAIGQRDLIDAQRHHPARVYFL